MHNQSARADLMVSVWHFFLKDKLDGLTFKLFVTGPNTTSPIRREGGETSSEALTTAALGDVSMNSSKRLYSN